MRQAPDPSVLGGEPAADDVPPAGLDRVLLAEQGAGQDAGVSTVPAAVVDRLSRATGVTATRQLAVPGSWTSVYGTTRVAQLALVPAQPADLLAAVSHHCPSCGLEQPAAVCPFCHVIGRSLVSVAHPSPGPPPATPHAGLPVLGGHAGDHGNGGAQAVTPPPAAGAAR